MDIKNLLIKSFGDPKSSHKSSHFQFNCPHCAKIYNNGRSDDKFNLEVDLNKKNYKKAKHVYRCWKCGIHGKLSKLLKYYSNKLDYSIYMDVYGSTYVNLYEDDYDREIVAELPKEFIQLKDLNNRSYKTKSSLKYLYDRGINDDIISKFNIGCCLEGKYNFRIIIPSYDENGILNYFTGRSFKKDPFIKYKNPTVSRDIIPFELYINWDLPIILCEGPFDATTIKRNTIPLLGKNIQSTLMKKIVKSSVEKIYIALDRDAQKQALSFCEKLMSEGKEVYLVDMQDKDPSEMGFENFTKLIQDTYPLTFSSLLGKKLTL